MKKRHRMDRMNRLGRTERQHRRNLVQKHIIMVIT